MVADAKIDSFISKDEIHIFFDEGALFAASPLGMNKYRVAANIYHSHPRQIFYEKEVVEIVQERGHGAYYVTDISWISPFWIHSKVAEHMRQGSIFLAGDAAHIHAIENLIFDPDNMAHTRYHVKDTGVYIIRPDHCIGYCSESLERVKIEKFFQQFV